MAWPGLAWPLTSRRPGQAQASTCLSLSTVASSIRLSLVDVVSPCRSFAPCRMENGERFPFLSLPIARNHNIAGSGEGARATGKQQASFLLSFWWFVRHTTRRTTRRFSTLRLSALRPPSYVQGSSLIAYIQPFCVVDTSKSVDGTPYVNKVVCICTYIKRHK